MPFKRASEGPCSLSKNKRQCSLASTSTSTSIPPSQDEAETHTDTQVQELLEQLNKVRKELSESIKVSQSQADLLESVRTSLRCNICLDTLDSPYTLLCGHIFCHKDLYAHFHSLPPNYDSELEFEAYDSDFDGQDRARSIYGPTPVRARSPLIDRSDPSTGQPEAGPSTSNSTAPPQVLPPRLSAYRRKQNLICPECRAPVYSAPFPLYGVKKAADFLRIADPTTETGTRTSEDAPHRHDPEAHRDEKDKTWGNIFKGDKPSKNVAIRDVEDGVRRCTNCAWEITHEGTCERCGEIFSSEEDSDVDDQDDANSDASFERRTFVRRLTRGHGSLESSFPITDEANSDMDSGSEDDSYASSSDHASSSEGSDLPFTRRRAGGGRRVIESDGSGGSDRSSVESLRQSDCQSSEASTDDCDKRTLRGRSNSRCEASTRSDDDSDEYGNSAAQQPSDYDSWTSTHGCRRGGGRSSQWPSRSERHASPNPSLSKGSETDQSPLRQQDNQSPIYSDGRSDTDSHTREGSSRSCSRSLSDQEGAQHPESHNYGSDSAGSGESGDEKFESPDEKGGYWASRRSRRGY